MKVKGIVEEKRVQQKKKKKNIRLTLKKKREPEPRRAERRQTLNPYVGDVECRLHPLLEKGRSQLSSARGDGEWNPSN